MTQQSKQAFSPRMLTRAIALLLLFTGCSSVTIPQPLSSPPQPVDQEQFEGTWLFEHNTFAVRFASNGVARIACTEWRDDDFGLLRGEMVVTEGRENNYISVRFEEDGQWTNDYLVFQYKFAGDALVLWWPNVDEFEAAIRAKRLQGDVSKNKYAASISITNSPSELLAFLNDPARKTLFEYKDPIVLRRVAPADTDDRHP